jgi:hypothetical protein
LRFVRAAGNCRAHFFVTRSGRNSSFRLLNTRLGAKAAVHPSLLGSRIIATFETGVSQS